MESYPKFHNEVGVPIVRIGCGEFKCIGDKPPQDHQHIYLKMGDACEIVCPIALRYCASIRAWAHTKLIRQVALTVKWTEHGFGPWWRTKCRHHRAPGDERQSCGSSGNFHRSLHALGPCYCLSEHQEDQRTA